MTPRVVIDTCVAFKWFSEEGEGGVPDAVDLYERSLRDEIVLAAPASILLELSNALRYSMLSQEQTLLLIESLDLPHIELFDVTTQRLHRSAALSYRYEISVYDALFLALAAELECPLVTADRRAFAHVNVGDIRFI
jgi:predicted nucleic acid-binding protein